MKKPLSLFSTLLIGFTAITHADPSDNPLPKLHVINNQFVDGQGRTVILHGLNEMNKQPPYTPSAIGFDERNIQFIADHGFNVVRLGVFWAGIQPTPGSYDTAYLNNIKQTITLLAKHNIYTFVDFHQDSYSTLHNGAGEPEWAALGVGPFTNFGFPANNFGGMKEKGQTVGPQVDEDYDYFWQNKSGNLGIGVQTLYTTMLSYTASYLKGTPGIIGYELMNEPFPGSDWRACFPKLNVRAGCYTFEKQELVPFTKRAIQAIRAADPDATIFYEPVVFTVMGAPTFIGDLHSQNLVFSFHNYDTLNKNLPFKDKYDMELPFKNAQNQLLINHAAPLMSEFDAQTPTPKELATLLDLADHYQTSWTDWAYTNNPGYTFTKTAVAPSDPRVQGLVLDATKPLINTNVNWTRLAELTRPYPQAIAGKLLSYSYDTQNNTFTLLYAAKTITGKKISESSVTTIYVPQLNYPNGYQVKINGATVTSAKNSSQLTVKNNSDSLLVKIVVTTT